MRNYFFFIIIPATAIILFIAASLAVKLNQTATRYQEQVAGLATEKTFPLVTLQTEAGKIVIQLSMETPKTSQNFLNLVRKGFYNGLIFHRVIKGFMIQGGDPTGTGAGGPGYQFADEPFTGEYTRGTVAMANAGPNTNGSQFFIMHQDYPLQKNYVIFGKVISGMEAVDKIAEAPTNPTTDRPINPVKIISATAPEE
jgi:cyclophilin family peptidyl-prolyl cis-trans isomerase